MDLIVVSDLHLSAGYNQATGKYARKEDFFFDEEFKDFLEFLQRVNSRKKHLIIAGDLFDFLQVDGSPTSELYDKEVAHYEVTSSEQVYGPGTGEAPTLGKLKIIVEGHQVFFQALACFLSKDNCLSIISGNHDIELYWPEVRSELKEHIAGFAPDPNAKQHIRDRIFFYSWFFYSKEHQSYIEHGNQYDEFNSFPYLLYPVFKENSPKLWLPFGSLFVRYFFNKIESRNPFADNIKPVTEYMFWALKNDQLQFLVSSMRYLYTTLKIFIKAGTQSKAEKEELATKNKEKMSNISERTGFSLDALETIYALMAEPFTKGKLVMLFCNFGIPVVTVTFLTAVLLVFLSKVIGFSPWTSLVSLVLLIFPVSKLIWNRKNRKDAIEQIVRKIKKNLHNVRIIVFGHTHDPDKMRLDNDCWYFNTGTWTTVFSKEERIIREAKQFGFVWVQQNNGTVHADLYQWNQNLMKPEKLILFEPQK